MIAGPIFSREVLTLPRQFRHYLIRSGYIGLLFVLLWTASQVTFGFQDVRGISAMAGFGQQVFQILALVQLSLVLFFSLLFTAGNIAQEKDRQTLILLLMTDLSNHEIVLGKLFASVLQVGTLILISAPVFLFLQLLGGIAAHQIFWLIAICFVTALLGRAHCVPQGKNISAAGDKCIGTCRLSGSYRNNRRSLIRSFDCR